MAYILGYNIEEKKAIVISLTKIYGIGRKLAKTICEKVKINPLEKVEKLTEKQKRDISREIKSNCIIDVELKRKVYNAIKEKMEIRSYQGLRHRYRLPVKGQRTRSNAATAKKLLIKNE